MAYRGRVLLSVDTAIGNVLPDQPVTHIGTEDLVRVQKYLRRRKYRLYASFMEASMINETETAGSIEFEVSIGNFGNKLESNVTPQPSSTQPTNAVYDGLHYYFLPWLSNKPLIVVDSDWEDISFRLESLNLLFSKIQRIVSSTSGFFIFSLLYQGSFLFFLICCSLKMLLAISSLQIIL